MALTSNFIWDSLLRINTVFIESNKKYFSEQLILLKVKVATVVAFSPSHLQAKQECTKLCDQEILGQ